MSLTNLVADLREAIKDGPNAVTADMLKQAADELDQLYLRVQQLTSENVYLKSSAVEPPPVQVPDVSADLSRYGFAFVLVRPGGARYRIDPLDVTLQRFPDQPENR